MAFQASFYDDNSEDVQSFLEAQTEVYNHCFNFMVSLAMTSAIELRIPDIIYSYGHPVTVTEIASKIESKSPNVHSLGRLVQFLAQENIFTISHNQKNEPVYGLTLLSKLLIQDYSVDGLLSFAPLFHTITHPTVMAPWHEIGRSIIEGGTPFALAHNGEIFWEKLFKDPELNEMFNDEMALLTRVTMDAIMKGYKDEFSKLKGTLVDVAGGTGNSLAEIVNAHPQITGINFDLPHVVATASPFPGVTHVGGDMFSEIPEADTIFEKSVLHNWGDEDCIKILKNFREAIAEKNGKVILVEIVLPSGGKDPSENKKMTVDLYMMTLFSGGKERTENEWKKLLQAAGFVRYNIIKTHSLGSIIEAYPQ